MEPSSRPAIALPKHPARTRPHPRVQQRIEPPFASARRAGRAAASLDLLSDGRFELGLGAGGFWDAIRAMGGRKLTRGQGVDALEGIDATRSTWNVSDRSILHYDGTYYQLDGREARPRAGPQHTDHAWRLQAANAAPDRRALITELFSRIGAKAGISPHSVEITITETPKVNWGVRGQNAADLALNYRVEI